MGGVSPLVSYMTMELILSNFVGLALGLVIGFVLRPHVEPVLTAPRVRAGASTIRRQQQLCLVRIIHDQPYHSHCGLKARTLIPEPDPGSVVKDTAHWIEAV